MPVPASVRGAIESIRCLKHNLLDNASFSVSFADGCYQVVTAENIRMRFRHNPYLGFYQVTAGYLRGSAQLLRPGMCVVDAGACDGEFALYASRCVGASGRVFALEPDPENFERLRDTFALNGGVPANVQLLQAGLWKHSGIVRFESGHYLGSKVTESPADARIDATATSMTVNVLSLPDLVARFDVGRLDFVKMDIEGAELEAVEGAQGLLSGHGPTFAIAAYHIRDGRPTAETLEGVFRACHYDATTGFPDHPTTYAAPRSGPAPEGWSHQ